jgi:hypothetical protein
MMIDQRYVVSWRHPKSETLENLSRLEEGVIQARVGRLGNRKYQVALAVVI